MVGYSGRDASIMATLVEAYLQPGSGRLYWCGHPEQTAPENVLELLYVARSSGRIAHYIPTDGFDPLLTRLALHCLTGDLLKHVQDLCSQTREKALE